MEEDIGIQIVSELIVERMDITICNTFFCCSFSRLLLNQGKYIFDQFELLLGLSIVVIIDLIIDQDCNLRNER